MRSNKRLWARGGSRVSGVREPGMQREGVWRAEMKEINWGELRIELIGWYKPYRYALDGGISWRKQSLRILSGEVRSRELVVSVGGGLN